MSGKGSAPRPFSVDQKTYQDNWNRVFGAKKQTQNLDSQEWDSYSDLSNPNAYKKDTDADKS